MREDIFEATAYTFSDICRMAYSFALTKLFFRGARLVRRPISIRGKKRFLYGTGFTSGRNCRIEIFGNGKVTFGKNCLIGDYVHIAAGESVSLGDNCLLASKIFISDLSHGIYKGPGAQSSPCQPPNERALHSDPVFIGNNVWIGDNVSILGGVSIGDGCVIGSNAVVTRSIPARCIAGGIPATVLKVYDEEKREWKKV